MPYFQAMKKTTIIAIFFAIAGITGCDTLKKSISPDTSSSLLGTRVLTEAEISTFKSKIVDTYANEGTASYPWNESYILMSFVEIFTKTNDRFFLDKLVDQFTIIMAKRSDKLGLRDEIRD
ncbi:MAG: hypothetical protein ACI9BD_000343 [Candidatus Marinamargulisbacteria bacterium]|jgi:hypothetical protein